LKGCLNGRRSAVPWKGVDSDLLHENADGVTMIQAIEHHLTRLKLEAAGRSDMASHADRCQTEQQLHDRTEKLGFSPMTGPAENFIG